MTQDTRVVELDPCDFGVVFNSLNDTRNQLREQGEETEAVDDVILKVAKAPPKKGRWRDETR
jgi:hypothetical protein